MMKRRVAVLVAVTALVASREARADVKHVVLSSPAGTEVTERLRAELVLKGFRVSMFGPLPTGCFGDDLGKVAAGADAAVCVDDSVHVFVRKDDKLPHTDTVASVDASDIAAMRAAEIVRVRLELASMPEPPPPTPPTEPIVVRVEATDPALLQPPDRIEEDTTPPAQIRVGLSAGLIYDASTYAPNSQEGGVGYPTTGLSVIFRPAKAPGWQPVLDGSLLFGGSSVVTGGAITGGVRYRLFEDAGGRMAVYLGPNAGVFMNRDVDSRGRQASKGSPTIGMQSSIEVSVTDRVALAVQTSGSFFLDENPAMKAPLGATLGIHTAL